MDWWNMQMYALLTPIARIALWQNYWLQPIGSSYTAAGEWGPRLGTHLEKEVPMEQIAAYWRWLFHCLLMILYDPKRIIKNDENFTKMPVFEVNAEQRDEWLVRHFRRSYPVNGFVNSQAPVFWGRWGEAEAIFGLPDRMPSWIPIFNFQTVLWLDKWCCKNCAEFRNAVMHAESNVYWKQTPNWMEDMTAILTQCTYSHTRLPHRNTTKHDFYQFVIGWHKIVQAWPIWPTEHVTQQFWHKRAKPPRGDSHPAGGKVQTYLIEIRRPLWSHA